MDREQAWSRADFRDSSLCTECHRVLECASFVESGPVCLMMRYLARGPATVASVGPTDKDCMAPLMPDARVPAPNQKSTPYPRHLLERDGLM